MLNKILIVVCLLLFAGIGLQWQRQQKKDLYWQSEQAALEQRLQDQKTQTVAATQKELGQEIVHLQEQLNRTTDELKTARLKVEAYEAKQKLEAEARAAVAKRSEDTSRIMAEVPAPTVTSATNPAGKIRKVYTFPKLIGAGGNTLATDAEFRSQFGRRLIFRSGNGRPLAYDMEELHPGVLLHLGITKESAMRAQAGIDAQVAQAEKSYKAHLASKAEADRIALEQRTKLAAEYAKIAEERRKAQVEEQLKTQAAETERMKAEASLRASDAALKEALRPYYPDYIIDQIVKQQQQQGSFNPVGSTSK